MDPMPHLPGALPDPGKPTEFSTILPRFAAGTGRNRRGLASAVALLLPRHLQWRLCM